MSLYNDFSANDTRDRVATTPLQRSVMVVAAFAAFLAVVGILQMEQPRLLEHGMTSLTGPASMQVSLSDGIIDAHLLGL